MDDPRNVELRTTFLGKIKYDDFVHAAFAGWTTFENMQYYQALYTTPGEELSMVDIVHVQESNGTSEEPYDTLVHEIHAVQDALYAENPELGWNDEVSTVYEPGGDPNWHLVNGVYSTPHQLPGGNGSWNHCVKHYVYDDPYDSRSRRLDYTDYYYNENYIASADRNNNMLSRDTNSVDIGGEGNIRILGAEIPGSSLLKVFLKRNKYKQAALGIAAKTEKGFGTFGAAANGSKTNSDGTENLNYLGDIFTPGKDENGRYSNPLGIPRLAPALFGGPHGAYASPQTMQAYFDPDNPFLMSVPRINPAIKAASNCFTSNNKKVYYSGIESAYMYPAGRGSSECYIGRSPSETLHMLTSGYCEVLQGDRIETYKRVYTEIEASPYLTYNYVSYDSYGKAISTSWSSKLRVSVYGYAYPWVKGRYPKSQGGGPRPIEFASIWYATGRTRTYCVGPAGYASSVYPGPGVARTWISGGYVYADCYVIGAMGAYWDYFVERYNRPLLHCIPFYGRDHLGNSNYSRWIIAKYSASVSPDVWTKEGSFAQFLAAWGSRDPEVRMCSEYHMMKRIAGENVSNTKYYRLTMPYYGDNYKYNSQSVYSGWWEDWDYYRDCYNPGQPGYHMTWTDRYYPELEFVAYMLKNAGSPGSNNWTNIFYCYSDPTDSAYQRNTTGPRALVQIPTRLQRRTCTYNEFVSYKHRCGHKPPCDPCHDDWTAYVTGDIPIEYKYIEVDVDNAKCFWAAANWSKIYSPNIVNKDIMTDIPGQEYRVPVPNAVWQLVSGNSAPRKFRFAGKGFTENDAGDDGGQYLSGWGMYSAMPCFNEIPGQSSFEDANEVLCFRRLGNVSADTPLTNFTFSVPIFTSPGGATRSIDGQYFYNPYESNRRCSYVARSMRLYDPGFANFMEHFYTSCTLFVPESTSKWDTMAPFTVDISNCLVSAMKLLEHQRAYLQFGKELFQNSVEASEVIRIIDKCIDKRIVSASIGAKRNVRSIYYNPWIDKAYDIYSKPNATKLVIDSFQNRINAMDLFLERANVFMTKTGARTVDEITARYWSYNNYLECYDVFR
jgi:hypothetical protein